MRTFVAEASDAIGIWLVPQPTENGHRVAGAYRSPRNGERVRALGAEPIALGQQPVRVWRRIVGGS